MRRALLLILLIALLGASTSLGVAWFIGGVQPEWAALGEVAQGDTGAWKVVLWTGRGHTIWQGFDSDNEYPSREIAVPKHSILSAPPRFEHDQVFEHTVGWPIESWRVRWLRHPSFYGQLSSMDVSGGLMLARRDNSQPYPAQRFLALSPHWSGAFANAGIWSGAWLGIAMLAAAPGAMRSMRRRRRKRCVICGYDLRGRDEGVCPECGSPRSARRPVIGGGLLTLLGAALAVMVISQFSIGALVARLTHGHHPLHFAARDGDVKAIERALANGAAVDVPVEKTTYYDGMTPLMWAAAAGQTEAIRVLLEHGADVNAQDADGGTALMRAARAGQAGALDLLLAHGADPNLKGESGRTALHEAIFGDANALCIRRLIEAGADVNAQYDRLHTALGSAAFFGQTEIVRILIESGADVNLPDWLSPLDSAVYEGHADVVRLLLEAGASPHDPDENLMERAISNGDAESLRLLIEHNAPRPQERPRWTLFHRAVNDGHTEVVRVLVAAGFDPTFHGGGERSPLQMAIDLSELNEGYEEIIDILTRAVEEWNRTHGDGADQ